MMHTCQHDYDFFCPVELYKPFEAISIRTKVVTYVKNAALFEYEVKKVIRPKAALNAPFFDFFLKNGFFQILGAFRAPENQNIGCGDHVSYIRLKWNLSAFFCTKNR